MVASSVAFLYASSIDRLFRVSKIISFGILLETFLPSSLELHLKPLFFMFFHIQGFYRHNDVNFFIFGILPFKIFICLNLSSRLGQRFLGCISQGNNFSLAYGGRGWFGCWLWLRSYGVKNLNFKFLGVG